MKIRNWSKETIEKALDHFQPEYKKRGRTLTEQDAVNILDNLTEFIELLIESHEKEKSK